MKEFIIEKKEKDFHKKEKRSYKAFKKIISNKNKEKNIKLLKEILNENQILSNDIENKKNDDLITLLILLMLVLK